MSLGSSDWPSTRWPSSSSNLMESLHYLKPDAFYSSICNVLPLVFQCPKVWNQDGHKVWNQDGHLHPQVPTLWVQSHCVISSCSAFMLVILFFLEIASRSGLVSPVVKLYEMKASGGMAAGHSTHISVFWVCQLEFTRTMLGLEEWQFNTTGREAVFLWRVMYLIDAILM